MKFEGVIKEGRLYFLPAIAEQRRRFLARFKQEIHATETIEVCYKPKTKKQLATIWGLLLATLVTELNDRGYDTSFILRTPHPTGNPITADLLKEFLYEVCPIYDDDGKRITLRSANTRQASKFFEDCRNYAATQWGIIVPDPVSKIITEDKNNDTV